MPISREAKIWIIIIIVFIVITVGSVLLAIFLNKKPSPEEKLRMEFNSCLRDNNCGVGYEWEWSGKPKCYECRDIYNSKLSNLRNGTTVTTRV
jgi:hypothetical protein